MPQVADDGITDGIEYKGYGTSPLLTNTDGDTGPLSQPCNDGREVAAVDSNTVVNSNDLLIVAQSFGAADRPNMDANKNGVINSGDLLLVAGQFVVTPC